MLHICPQAETELMRGLVGYFQCDDEFLGVSIPLCSLPIADLWTESQTDMPCAGIEDCFALRFTDDGEPTREDKVLKMVQELLLLAGGHIARLQYSPQLLDL